VILKDRSISYIRLLHTSVYHPYLIYVAIAVVQF